MKNCVIVHTENYMYTIMYYLQSEDEDRVFWSYPKSTIYNTQVNLKMWENDNPSPSNIAPATARPTDSGGYCGI